MVYDQCPPRCQETPDASTGQGVGCSFLLEQGVWADCALIAKPGLDGFHGKWDELVRDHGARCTPTSARATGCRTATRLPQPAEVVAKLEEWFPKYSAAHQGGLVAPQRVVT